MKSCRLNWKFFGEKLNFTLTGMTGSQKVESQVVDIVVESMDGSTSVALENIRTVRNIPISEGWIPRKDLKNCHHFENVDLHEAESREVMLIIGVNENPQMFLPLYYKWEVRISQWQFVIAWVGQSWDQLVVAKKVSVVLVIFCKRRLEIELGKGIEKEQQRVNGVNVKDPSRVDDEMLEQVIAVEDRDSRLDEDGLLKRELERLWKTDFGDSVVSTKPCQSEKTRKRWS